MRVLLVILIIALLCLLGGFIALYVTEKNKTKSDEDHLQFPKDFMIGAATSAYQVEGAWNISGRTETLWDVAAHNTSLVVDNSTGNIACDSYHKYKEDVKLLKNMNLDHYRFSLSWSRILPNGTTDYISKDGLQYYKNLTDELVNNGIEPFVTIAQFDEVSSLVRSTGGWLNESMIKYFEDYARLVFRELGPKVKYWSTFNEPNIYCSELYEPAGKLVGYPGAGYVCAHNMLKAHARVYHIYDSEFRPTQKGKIGLVTLSTYHYPTFQNDTTSSKIAFDFETGWIMHPIFSEKGGYPEIMKQRIAETSKAEGLPHSKLPEFSQFWIEYIKGASDYFGVNHYASIMVEPIPKVNGRWANDSGIKRSPNPKWPKTLNTRFTIFPKGMRGILNQIKDAYGNPPVYILENGCSLDFERIDTSRISFLYAYMKQLLLAIRDGCNVKAYTVWSLMDNFEWFGGYTMPYGLIQVDFNSPNRTRTPRLSSYWLKTVASQKRLIPHVDVANITKYEELEI